MACQVLESERAERLRAFREVQELKVGGPGVVAGVAEQGGWEPLGLPASLSAHMWEPEAYKQEVMAY